MLWIKANILLKLAFIRIWIKENRIIRYLLWSCLPLCEGMEVERQEGGNRRHNGEELGGDVKEWVNKEDAADVPTDAEDVPASGSEEELR